VKDGVIKRVRVVSYNIIRVENPKAAAAAEATAAAEAAAATVHNIVHR